LGGFTRTPYPFKDGIKLTTTGLSRRKVWISKPDKFDAKVGDYTWLDNFNKFFEH
jgi:hypothetical protein